MGSDWQVSALLRDTREELDKYTERVDGVLKSTREDFAKDYSAAAAGVGFLLCVAALVLAVLDKSPTAVVAGLLVGAGLIVLGALMRRRTRDLEPDLARSVMDMERQKLETRQRALLLQHAAEMEVDQVERLVRVRALLGEQPMPSELARPGVGAAPALPDGDTAWDPDEAS